MFFQLFFSRIIGLPVWWYGQGLATTVRALRHAVSDVTKSLELHVWMKNLFVPMYGDTSLTGRAISFGMRLVMIIGRGFAVVVSAIVLSLIFVLYLVALPVVIIGLIYSLFV